MTRFSDQQSERLRDLLKEKSLWKVYLSSRRIPFSWINSGVGLVVSIIVAALGMQAKSTSALADQLLTFATTGFSLCIAQLGFLLAGFSFFATVADKEMFCRMADKTHQASGLSYLKYNFLVFMRVFVEYLAFCLVCLGLMVLLENESGIRDALSSWTDNLRMDRLRIAAVMFGLFVGCVVYLLMQLASFIFNIYHVVMTSIRWELQKDYDRQNSRKSLSGMMHSQAQTETSSSNGNQVR